jgi:dihydrofolate reductase
LGKSLAGKRGAGEVAVIGGADVFALALPYCDRIYLTRVHGTPAGDTYFATPDPSLWAEHVKEPMAQSADDQFSADFIVLDRKK